MAVNLNRINTFNTGRQYSNKGQRIAYVLLPDDRVMFADVDRNIDGVTKRPCIWNTGVAAYVKEFVMTEYDYGRINYDAWAWEDIKEMNREDSQAYRDNMENLMQRLKDAANAI